MRSLSKRIGFRSRPSPSALDQRENCVPSLRCERIWPDCARMKGSPKSWREDSGDGGGDYRNGRERIAPKLCAAPPIIETLPASMNLVRRATKEIFDIFKLLRSPSAQAEPIRG